MFDLLAFNSLLNMAAMPFKILLQNGSLPIVWLNAFCQTSKSPPYLSLQRSTTQVQCWGAMPGASHSTTLAFLLECVCLKIFCPCRRFWVLWLLSLTLCVHMSPSVHFHTLRLTPDTGHYTVSGISKYLCFFKFLHPKCSASWTWHCLSTLCWCLFGYLECSLWF